MVYELLAYGTDSRNGNDIRWREYTASKKRAELFAKIPRIQFSDSGHGVVFTAREHKGKRLPCIDMCYTYVSEEFNKLQEAAKAQKPKRKTQIEALKDTGIKCKCACNGFFHLDGTNAAWNLADRFDGKEGTLVFIIDKSGCNPNDSGN